MFFIKPMPLLFRNVILLVVFLSLGCSTLRNQSKNSIQEPPSVQGITPNLAKLCKESPKQETLEIQNVSKSIKIHHGQRFAIADPPDEGYHYECGIQSFVNIQWKLNELTLIESVVENESYSVYQPHDESNDYYFYDAKMTGSELVVFLKLGYHEDKIPNRFKLDRKLKKIIRLTPGD